MIYNINIYKVWPKDAKNLKVLVMELLEFIIFFWGKT